MQEEEIVLEDTVKKNNPNLILYKDITSQTDLSYVHEKSVSPWLSINIKKMSICLILLYILICVITIVSTRIQTLIVYANFVRIPMGDLTNLKRFRLTSTRNIELVTEDGLLLKGWHILPPGNVSKSAAKLEQNSRQSFYDESLTTADRIIIFFHGQAGNRGTRNRPPLMKRLASEFSSHVIAIDYRGFGDSEGWPSESGTHLDALAVVQWVISRLNVSVEIPGENGRLSLKNRNSFPPVYVYGQSLGSGVSAALLADLANRSSNLITGLILDAGFTSLPDASLSHPAGAIFRIIPRIKNIMLRFLKFSYPNREYVAKITIPVLLLHGQKDSLIPISHSRELYQIIQKSSTSSPLSRLVEVPDAGHITVYLSSEWLNGVSEFFIEVEQQSLKIRNNQCNNIVPNISVSDKNEVNRVMSIID